MAVRGSNKRFSVDHEDYIAELFNGRRSPSSGASAVDKGDVTSDINQLKIECKVTTSEKKPTMFKLFEKIFEEASSVGYSPMLAYRYFDPSSVLSDRSGWIDLVVMKADTVAEFYDKVR